MKRLVFLFLFLLLPCANAQAQSSTRAQAQAVATCGGQSLTAGVFYPVTQDLTGTLCTQTGGGGSTAVTIADGADVGEGATTATAATAGSTGSVNAKLRLMTTQLATINTTLGTPAQVGGAVTANAGTNLNTSALALETGGNLAAILAALGTAPPPSASSAIGITPVVSSAAESSHVLKASAGNAYAAYAANLTATNGFLVLINAVSAPVDGAITPLACAPLSANGVASINYSPAPPGVFSTGIVAVVTSAATCFTKTTGTLTAFISGLVK